MQVEVGQTWASAYAKDVANNHNQQRRVLALTTTKRYQRPGYVDVPVAVLTCDGEGGRMRSRVSLGAGGEGINNHRFVAPADPGIVALAQVFDGIETRQWSRANPEPLAPLVHEALLFPFKPDGSEHPKVEVRLSQQALHDLARRVHTLASLAEQSALVSADGIGVGYAPAQPAMAAAEALSASLDAIADRLGVPPDSPAWGEPDPDD